MPPKRKAAGEGAAKKAKGESGANALKGPFSSPKDAVKEFERFTTIAWVSSIIEQAAGEPKESASKLDKPTQGLIKLIFDNDIFKSALQTFNIDTKKMPLRKLSKTQIAKGFEVLEELEEAINKKQSATKINELTSRFYTVIPHSFGRSVPPPIKTAEEFQTKYDMLAVLGDIEIAQSLQKDREVLGYGEGGPNVLDVKYGLLQCTLKLLDKRFKRYKILEKNFQATKGTGRMKLELLHIWEVDRSGEGVQFAANKKIKERKLLWHGTNVANVAAILKKGLRIMPDSRGRAGKGIYFASENNKSAGYVVPAQGKGIMFLNEVALGKEKRIVMDDSSLKAAPKGFDSVHACGQQEPDPEYDTKIELEGNDVVVPQGEPKKIPEYENSSFWQSEYVVYRENQARIRYLLLFSVET